MRQPIDAKGSRNQAVVVLLQGQESVYEPDQYPSEEQRSWKKVATATDALAWLTGDNKQEGDE